MHVFIDFWKLKTENNLLHVFSFLHKLNFENSFCFLPILSCQTSFLVLKIENCFWKQKIRGKNSYQTYPYFLLSLYQNISLIFLSRNSFQSAGCRTWTGEHTQSSPSTSTLRPIAQPTRPTPWVPQNIHCKWS